MKISQKVGSLLRRNIPFFCLTYNWDTKQLQIIKTLQEYLQEITKLKDEGMCKRCQYSKNDGFIICDLSYDVRLVSFGDIRAQRCVFGENPISKQFGICMFDYVFLFLTKKQKKALKNTHIRKTKIPTQNEADCLSMQIEGSEMQHAIV